MSYAGYKRLLQPFTTHNPRLTTQTIMLEKEFAAARAQFEAAVQTMPREGTIGLVHDVDADGVTAGVVWQRVLERLGFNVSRLMPDRERNVWTDANRAAIAAVKPDFLWVLDLGCRDGKVLENTPTAFLDHHRPEGVLDEDVLITGYGWPTVPNTSWMCYEMALGKVPVEDMDWIAVIGTLSDLGEKAPWPLIAQAKKKYTAKWLKEATALVNAPRRASRFDPEAAARALMQFDNPKDLCNSEAPDVMTLKAARAEVSAEMLEAKKAAPKFAGEAALIQINSPCQIHPLIAQIWRGRLPKYHVICANSGYMENRVNFSARSATGRSVLDFLKSFELAGEEGHFGHGHDQASGGSLPPDRWRELLSKMGFDLEVGS